jgi:RHS repeat-associated protein
VNERSVCLRRNAKKGIILSLDTSKSREGGKIGVRGWNGVASKHLTFQFKHWFRWLGFRSEQNVKYLDATPSHPPTYSAFGIPTFLSTNNTQLSTSAYGIRHLFQNQLWTQETGLNDYRNRVELPKMGVFLQPDPIGFKGDAANVYRFCNNNAVNRTDPMGLIDRDWDAVRQAMDHCNLIGFFQAEADANAQAASTAALPSARRRAEAQGVIQVEWSDEGNRNIHEPRVHDKTGRAVNALTEDAVSVTAEKNRLTVHYVVDVRYSDNVGPHSKEMQKREPDHANELDRDFRHDRGPKIVESFTRPGGPLDGVHIESARSILERRLESARHGVHDESHDRHDYWNPLTGRHGDHVLVHPDGLNY